MTENVHERAQQLLAQALVEGLSQAEQSWLDQHLRDCADCSREANSTHELLRAMRAVPVAVPQDLVARAQLRVRLRAEETAPSSTAPILWALTAVSWLLGVFSAPLVWRGFAWLGAHAGLPKPVLEIGFVLWWVVPALLAAAAVLHYRTFAGAQKGL